MRVVASPLLFVWFVSVFGMPAVAAAQSDQVQWSLERLQISVSPGARTTASVSFRTARPLGRIQIEIVSPAGERAIGGRVHPAVEALEGLSAGVPQSITLVAAVGPDDQGSYEGRLELRANGGPIAVLPLVLVVGARPVLPDCAAAPGSGPRLEATEAKAQTLTVPPDGCRITVTTPHDDEAFPLRDRARHAWRIEERSENPDTLVRIELRGGRDPRRGDDNGGEFYAASDVPRADQALIVQDEFDGWLELTRLDVKDQPMAVTVRLFKQDLERDPRRQTENWFVGALASTGHAYRTEIDTADQRALISLAENYRSRDPADPVFKTRAFTLISKMIGRRVSPQKIDKATESEPMVVFLGLSGLNRVVLLDCVSRLIAGSHVTGLMGCVRLSEPWQTTFERATHFWAVYLEDEQTGFDTSIDIEFPRESRSPDYDDYDPLNSVRGVTATDANKRRVRVGYRRFTIPPRHDLIRVTFSRQGASYGLRSWSREYTRYGLSPVQFAGGAAIPAWFLTRSQFSLQPVFGPDPFSPVAVELTEDRTTQPIFAMGFVRFPPLKVAAEQSNSTARKFVPDIAYGVALPWITDEPLSRQTLIVGGSWQVGFGNRVHFLAALMRTRNVEGAPPVGHRFPPATSLDSLVTVKTVWRPLVGLSVDIARTP